MGVERRCHVDDPVAVLEEASIALCLAAPQVTIRNKLLSAVAAKLSVNSQQVTYHINLIHSYCCSFFQVDYYLSKRRPQVQVLSKTVQIGRIQIDRVITDDAFETK